MFKIKLTLFVAIFSALSVFPQSVIWKDISEPQNSRSSIHLKKYRAVSVDFEALKAELLQAPDERDVALKSSEFTISLPNPDGDFLTFTLVESSVMSSELQERYPNIRTFSGQGTGSYKSASIKVDFTLKGFHAQVLISGKSYYIDPWSDADLNTYLVYTRESFYDSNTESIFSCEVFGESLLKKPVPSGIREDERIRKERTILDKSAGQASGRATNGTQLRTYRLALACTGEYAQFHGGTIPLVMSAFTTSMNRVNGVFERDVSLRMVMVANTDDLIYLNGNTDPYTNGNGSAMLSQNQSTCNSVIGSANYDIGHVFSTGGGGVAYLNAPCGSNKAGGVTGRGVPVGDPFDIDYVAHEMGHQFGANHTQNNPCNRSFGAAFEPGSASTIMGYAGICAPDIQSNSDAHFHNHSYNEMVNFTVNGNGNSCPVTSSTGNTPPSVTVPAGGFFIPKQTPFELTGTATDPDGDVLTYCWEEYDLGPATAGGDNNLTNPSGNAPIFRSWPPMASATRVFPRISDLVNNTTVIGELLPTYSRDLTFRCTVRDNAANGGGVTDAQVAFEVTNSAGPFLVNSPNTNVSWVGNTSNTVTWSVANTNLAPVNCSNVDIFLSIDGGYTYPFTLATNTANDGSASVLVPNVSTGDARIKVKASNNIFFDISNQDFTISLGASNDYDVALQAILEPSGAICTNEISPVITFINLGTTTITSAEILYDLNGGSAAVYNWSGSLTTFQEATVNLPTTVATDGVNTLNITIQNPNSQPDQVSSNNSGLQMFNVNELEGLLLPVVNNFEAGFPGVGWSVVNPDSDITWEIEAVSNDVNCNSSNAASINFYSYNESGEIDDLVSPLLDLTGNQPELTFDYSYARYSSTLFDRLEVQVKESCETEWQTVWEKENLQLATAGTQTSPFSPGCGDWSSESIDLSAFSGSVIEVRFRGTTGYGNDLYLDNINIFSNAVLDCAGVSNGTASTDECEVCSGGTTGLTPNASCTDCNGVVNGTAFLDNCETCVGGNTGLAACVADCNGDFGGTATQDDCGVCDSNTANDNTTCLDCAGVVNGTASIDECEVCSGGTTGLTPNASCTDCNGVVNGTAFLDNCETCVGGNTGLAACVADCNGDFGGTATQDDCGVCDSNTANDNTTCLDCAGVVNGTASIDECEVCSGGTTGLAPNASCTDCNGVVNGTAFLDNCETCVGGNTGLAACVADCNGDFGGTATQDDCGVCDSNPANDNTTCLDCAGVVNGTASIDDCGVCSGGTTGLTPNASCADCEGIINGDALPGTICYNGTTAGTYSSDCNCEPFTAGAVIGNVNWNINCGSRNVTITLVNLEFAELNNVIITTIDENGHFTLEEVPAGAYNILVKVEGYLAKLSAGIVVAEGQNSFNTGAIIAGDVNGSNSINISDISTISASFGSLSTDDDYNYLADFNCDGIINVVDISVLNLSFGMVGDSVNP
ncbi:hypothetical protein G3O08_08735 [Cryomorpha ignava]|uniref:Dockerin domain-containing protein n=1 Tax=Cryomorpha ignava TaxID=101383 RepID=A0A7K3WSG1_9FLAO|nr:zinc-dependent metalloprotease family protein [Cryomorpha ignava]NEN23585.1 hypothetical protein [Cryomorpha ignava]